MREIGKGDRDGQIKIQEMLKHAQTESKQAQITAVNAMNNGVKVLAKRPQANLDDLEIRQAGYQHQFSNTCRRREMTLVQVEPTTFWV